MDHLEDLLVKVQNFTFKVTQKVQDCIDSALSPFFEATLEDTIVEKIGGGPHGYGDPKDTSVREVEHYLFPRMVWKKIRYEKCLDVTEKYYDCVNRNKDGDLRECKEDEAKMFKCKEYYYFPSRIDEVEKECIEEYVKLRSEFRKTGSDDDLWRIKMLMLEPGFDKLRQIYKENESYENMRKQSKKPTT